MNIFTSASGSKRETAALIEGSEWLNSPPLTADDLDGKIIVVSFWTYTCINWIRTLPFLREWFRVFADHDVVIIGVHTPEFSFESDLPNIRRESAALGVDYPVVVDSNYAIWKAFDNHYWPALYIIDPQGQVRHRHFGEGEYERSEELLRQLVREAGGGEAPASHIDYRGVELPADWEHVRSPETYVGSARPSHRVSIASGSSELRLNQWGLAGDWSIESERAVLRGGEGRIAYEFHARDVNLVMGTGLGGAAVPFRVRLDGHPPRVCHGLDIDAAGDGVVEADRMYQLLRIEGPIDDRTLEVDFSAPGVGAYVFTFG